MLQLALKISLITLFIGIDSSCSNIKAVSLNGQRILTEFLILLDIGFMTLHISFLEPLIPPFAEFKISETDFLRQLLRLFHYFSPLCSRIRINESSQQIFKLRSSWFSATFTQFFFPGLHPSIEIFKVNFELSCFGSCKVI